MGESATPDGTEQGEQHRAAFAREARGCTTGVRRVLHAVVLAIEGDGTVCPSFKILIFFELKF